MTKTHVFIVDDEPSCIETLTTLIENYHPGIHIIGHAQSMNAALPLLEKHKEELDILFLDIQMQGGDGFSLLQNLPEINFKVIFTTAYDQYAIRAIKFSALDYLLKPIDNVELTQAIEKYRAEKNGIEVFRSLNHFRKALIQNNIFNKLAIHTQNDVKFISAGSITYLESDSNYTTIHLDNKTSLVSSKNIGHYEDLLDPKQFFRIHNSYIVNLNKVQRYIKGRNSHIELDNGKVLEVSTRRKEALQELLGI